MERFCGALLGCVIAVGLLAGDGALAKPVKNLDGRATDVACALSDLEGSVACLGALDGNDSARAVSGAFGVQDWEQIAKVEAGKGGGASSGGLSISAGDTSGKWSFTGDVSLYSMVMVALKGGPTHSLYQMGDDTLSGIWFTVGIAKGNGKSGPGLSHLSLYGTRDLAPPVDGGNELAPVPLPAAWLALAAGLGGLGALRRLRAAG